MAIKLWKAGTLNAFSTTLDGSISLSDGTITLTSVTGLQYPGILVIDRQDGAGNNTPSIREYISYTGISGSQLTGCTRGVGTSTAQAHSSGALVEEIFSVTHWMDLYDFLSVAHASDGSLSLTNQLLTTPKIATAITDTNGNEIIKTPATSSAVNEITVTNAITGSKPVISATGGDSSIPLGLAGKAAFLAATGIKDLSTVGTTETVSWANGDRQKMTLDENLTITFSNAVEGQTLTLYMLQDGTGTNSITFADTITWADNITPTWTTTANKMNIAVITYIGSAYYGVGNAFA